jgi:hypothetical protein
MSCSRIRRELLWLSRYGELDSDSQPHLDHLVGCRGCRDAIGIDRIMVEQLRIALAERVAQATPSPGAWEQILARAQAPNRGPLHRFLGWSVGFIGLQRAATAIVGSGLALVLAVNTELVPMTVPVDQGPSVRAPEALEVSGSAVAPSLFFAEEPARAEWVSGVVAPEQEPARDPAREELAQAQESAVIEQAVFELRIGLGGGAPADHDGGDDPIDTEGLATLPLVVAVGEPS